MAKTLIRIANTDLESTKNVSVGLTKITGVGDMFSNAICSVLGMEGTKKVSELSDEDIKRIEEVVADPLKYNIPRWLLNRRKEPETGEDKHLSGANVKYVRDEDIKILKKIKSYKGLRHQWGLTLRGQRNKSNARRNKGKAASVKRKK